MNKPLSESDLATPKVTTGPITGSHKIYSAPELAPDHGQVGGPGVVAAHRAGVVHPNRGDRLAHHMGLQAAAHHLDFGQFGHLGGRFPRGVQHFPRFECLVRR